MVGRIFFRKQLQCYYCKVNGKFKRLSPGLEDAKRLHEALLVEFGCTKPTVRAGVTMHLAWVQNNRAETTLEKKKRILHSFSDMFGDMLAADVAPKHVDRWMKVENSGCGPTTAHDRLTELQTCWNWLEREGHFASGIKYLNKPTPRARELFIPFERWSGLFEAAGAAARPLLRFMIFTGCRVQEAVILECKHWMGGHFALPPSRAKGRKQGRAIHVPDWLVPEVKAQIDHCGGSGIVYRTRSGTPWNKNSINNVFKRLKTKLNEPELCATVLRHSFAADKIRRGQPIELIAKALGHTSTDMVYKRYGHLAAQVDRLKDVVNSAPEIEAKPVKKRKPR